MTKKRFVKLLSLGMCLVILLTMVLSCASGDTTEYDVDESNSVTTDDSNSLYDENGYLKDSLDGINYDGKDVNVITWDNNPYLFPLESSEDDEVIRLVYNRDRYLEERLGVNFVVIRKTSSASADKEHANALYNTMQSGTESFDVCAAYAI